MMILDTAKTIYAHLSGGFAGAPEKLRIAPQDRIALDPAGLEVEIAELGRKFFIPWGKIDGLTQEVSDVAGDIEGDDEVQREAEAREQGRLEGEQQVADQHAAAQREAEVNAAQTEKIAADQAAPAQAAERRGKAGKAGQAGQAGEDAEGQGPEEAQQASD